MTDKIGAIEKLMFAAAVRAVGVMVKELIIDHPVAFLLRDQITPCWTELVNLYDKALDLHHQELIASHGPDTPRPCMWEPGRPVVDISQEVRGGGHYYEMMDRSSCMGVVFQSLVVEHSVAKLLPEEVDKVGDLLADLYQHAARLSHDYKAE